MKIFLKPRFSKLFEKLDKDLQNEVIEKIELFKNKENHKQLHVHKLHGKLANYYSFSVNYKIRIVFDYLSKDEIVLLAVGSHDVYK